MYAFGGPDFLTQSSNPTKSASGPDTIESGSIVRVAVPGIEIILKAYFLSITHHCITRIVTYGIIRQ